MKYINTYNTQTEYDSDTTRQYPNVSYVKATQEVQWLKSDPTAIVTKFVTRSANQSKTITVRNYLNLFSGITADGEPLTLSTSDYFFTHTFAEAGEHEVVYKFKDPTTIPASVLTSSNMISMIIPSSVTTIANNSIKEGLTSIKVDSGNTVYDSRGNCNAIIETATNTLLFGCNNTVIPNTVTSIGGSAFYSCTGLTSITIPDSVTSIGGSAFDYSRLSGTLTIPNSVTSIGGSAFANIKDTSNTLSVILPNTITTIENGTFAHSTSLVSVTIPDTVTTIGDNAFYETGLTSITIPDSVTSIGKSQFFECRSLTSVTLGSSVASIGDSSFARCGRLTSVTSLNTTPPTYYSQYGNPLFYNVPATCAIYVPAASVDAYKAANGWSDRAAYIQAIQ